MFVWSVALYGHKLWAVEDSVEHTVFECGRWVHQRIECYPGGWVLTPDNVIEEMLVSAES